MYHESYHESCRVIMRNVMRVIMLFGTCVYIYVSHSVSFTK